MEENNVIEFEAPEVVEDNNELVNNEVIGSEEFSKGDVAIAVAVAGLAVYGAVNLAKWGWNKAKDLKKKVTDKMAEKKQDEEFDDFVEDFDDSEVVDIQEEKSKKGK